MGTAWGIGGKLGTDPLEELEGSCSGTVDPLIAEFGEGVDRGIDGTFKVPVSLTSRVRCNRFCANSDGVSNLEMFWLALRAAAS